MTNDIEKIIEESHVPEMEYVKPKRKSISYEVPEVVLPKTKAEEYREAKGRLSERTSAVSKAYRPGGKKRPERTAAPLKPDGSEHRTFVRPKEKTVKTVDLDSAATAVAGAASNAEREDIEKLKTRLSALRDVVQEPKWVGSADELIPFAWRFPLVPDIARPSKFYKAAVKTAVAKKTASDETLPTPSGH